MLGPAELAAGLRSQLAEVRLLYRVPIADMVFNGSITDFQSDGRGSNPRIRSK